MPRWKLVEEEFIWEEEGTGRWKAREGGQGEDEDTKRGARDGEEKEEEAG